MECDCDPFRTTPMSSMKRVKAGLKMRQTLLGRVEPEKYCGGGDEASGGGRRARDRRWRQKGEGGGQSCSYSIPHPTLESDHSMITLGCAPSLSLLSCA